jgi:CrcB protein
MTVLGEALLVASGGALGAATRYVVGFGAAALLGTAFPWGTLAVNLSGSLAAGVLLGFGDGRGLDPSVRLLAVTGFLGGYTTFSAFSVETLRLLEQQGIALAAGNVIASVALGLLAASVGLAIGRAL